MNPRHIIIEGKPYLWSELIRQRREQLAAFKEKAQQQPTLFELKDDTRPEIERRAADRYRQPSLFQHSGIS